MTTASGTRGTTASHSTRGMNFVTNHNNTNNTQSRFKADSLGTVTPTVYAL